MTGWGLLGGVLRRAADAALNWAAPTVRFTGPSVIPGATAAARVPAPVFPIPTGIGGPAATSPILPADLPPGGEIGDPVIEIIPVWDPPAGWARLMAWDCLFEDVDGHYCVTSFGDPVRAGQSCFASAQLMGLKRFAQRYPALHQKAVLLRIITPDDDPAAA